MCHLYHYKLCPVCGGVGGYVGSDDQWRWEGDYYTVDIKCEECDGSGYVEGVEPEVDWSDREIWLNGS